MTVSNCAMVFAESALQWPRGTLGLKAYREEGQKKIMTEGKGAKCEGDQNNGGGMSMGVVVVNK